ncbi:MAG: hypothetical protein GW808_02570 [Sphingomonadales bacterium]|nr:hypothetical protein [Sphingomonadales bacterium]NCO48467.1 hypothetical protein [Sphingomonadales bacterium]NCO99283.1 hypothetical protein [Sphingomonadales bacterium]NCP26230.1 hypothetical protein [Sphingomonadales bacterium]NCP42734.1 hypothetical protein [Sphingomonadales bacterium]
MKKLSALMMIITVPLSGCVMQEGDFPSLQKRPYETEPTITEPAAPAPLLAPLPAAVQNKLDTAVAQSQAAHDEFLESLPSAKSRVAAARGSAPSSESWVVAHMALAALEIERSPSVEALADIDTLYRDQLEREALEDISGGIAAITVQRDAVEEQVARQQAEIDAMKNGLR